MRNMKSILSRTLGILLSLSMVVTLSTAVLAATPYPSKPVRFIVATAPGGGADITTRLIAAKLTERLGRQVIVENHPGGGGIIGTERAAKAAPDGHTLLLSGAVQAIQPALQKLPYDPIKSFTPIALLSIAPNALVIHPSVPAYSVKELIVLAKQKPGQLIFVISGVGTTPHVAIELFKMMAGIDIKLVQFKSVAPSIIDLVGGHSHAAISSISGLLTYIKSGQLRVLGTSGLKRSPTLPDVPTVAEAGLPGYKAVTWSGIFAPTGTPTPIVDRLNRELKAILATDELKKFFLTQGAEMDYLGPTEFGAFFGQEMDQWAGVIKKANIKVEE